MFTVWRHFRSLLPNSEEFLKVSPSYLLDLISEEEAVGDEP